MPSLDTAVNWAVGIAEDDTHGYDQTNRFGPDYDCSSLVGIALLNGGFDVNPYGTWYTGNMHKKLTEIGWEEIAINAKRKRGDIFLRRTSSSGHVVLCVNESQIVHASINELGTTTGGETGDQTGNEICVRSFYTPSGGWTYHLRWPQPDDTPPKPTLHWKKSESSYLSESDKQNNAQIIYTTLSKYGWKLKPIAATLGNMERESTINPGLWQSFAVGNTSLGYGLCQWTPATKIIDYAKEVKGDKSDGYLQLDYLQNQTTALGYWVKRHGYDITFTEFKKSDRDLHWLTSAFMWNYENPGKPEESERWGYADKWYSYLQGIDITPPEIDYPDEPTPPSGSQGSLWPKLQSSGYNLKKLSKNQQKYLQTLNIGDIIYLRQQLTRSKVKYGRDFWGKRLTLTHDTYRIKDVKKNGYIVLQYKSEFCPIQLDPAQIGGIVD